MPNLLTHLDLFSGIGGFALAARRTGIKTIGFAEILDFPSRVLKKNFPDVINYGDVRNVRNIPCDILTGGIPCQPFSRLGKKTGIQDPRFLWPEMRRVCQESRPSWIIIENVTSIDGLALENVLSDLEEDSYQTQTFEIPACGINAPHTRQRIWILAYAGFVTRDKHDLQAHAFSDEKRQKEWHSARSLSIDRAWWQAEPLLDRVAHGLPDRLDRLSALGNSIIPQIAQVLMQAITLTTLL